jgi:hypothetical protein
MRRKEGPRSTKAAGPQTGARHDPAALVEKARDADLVATAERLGVRLKRGRTNETVGRCPKCGGDDQLRIDIKKKAWRCGRCSKGGVALDLVRHTRDFAFSEAVAFLANSEPHI